MEYVMYFCSFLDDVMFSCNRPYGVWRWQHLRERRAGASSHKFPTCSPGGATLFDIICDDDMRGAATGWWAAAIGIKAGGEVCSAFFF